jgi:serine/threonine protein kinase
MALPLSDTEHTLIGQTLNGRYRVIELIGTGGMSAVYRAEHVQLGRAVALKVLNAEMATHPEAMLRFEREAIVCAKIQHQHVVCASDTGRLADGSLYLVLELVEGQSLRELINAEVRLPVARALGICAQIADALDAAHRMGVVHRDLKPSNVMLPAGNGQSDFVKVLDFGMAREQGNTVAGEGLTQTGRIFGTPEYMAPEQARGDKVDERADLYALGAIAYEMLAGRPLFQAPELLALLIKHIQEAPLPLPPEIPEPVSRLVMALLEKDPERRPKTARQVSRSMHRLAADPARLSAPPSAPGLVRVARPPLVAVALALAAVIAVALIWAWPKGSAPAPRAETPAQPSTPTSTPAAADPEPESEPPPAPPPPDGSAELRLGAQLIADGEYVRGLDALEQALELKPAWGDDPALLGAVRRAVDNSVVRERALELAAKRLGASGVDLLIDVWLVKNQEAPAPRRARKWLDSAAVRKAARPAAQLALEIRGAKTCTAVRALLPRMKDHGDNRSAARLRRYRATNGCGFLGFGDCYKCLRRDDALEKAIALVAKRPGPSFSVK